MKEKDCFVKDTFISNYLPATTVDYNKIVGYDGSFVVMLAPTQKGNEVRLTIHTFDDVYGYEADVKPNEVGTASIKMTQETVNIILSNE